MADDNKSASIKEASEEAKAAAIKKMKEAQEKAAAKEEYLEEKSKDATSKTGSMADFVGAEKTTAEAEATSEQKFDEETGQPLLKQVKVYAPFQVYFDNDAFSVSAVNRTGPFDILPGHKNFLSLLLPGDIRIRSRGNEEKIKIERGVMHVRNDVVKVFLDV